MPAILSGWPVTVSGNKLTSPVFNGTDVYVADSAGYLYSYNASGTLVGNSSQLAKAGSAGIVDAPLVDAAAGTVYVFVGNDANTSGSAGCDNAAGCNGIFRFATSSFTTTSNTGTTCTATSNTAWATGSNCGVESAIGNALISSPVYDGAFDNTYMTAGGSPTTGNLWTCGYGSSTGGIPRLVYSPMSTSGFGSTTDKITLATEIGGNPGGNLTSGASTCSPVTEFFNTDDYIYMSVTALGTVTTSPTCAGACIYSYTVTSTPAATVSHGLPVSGGSSGMIIDNNGTSGGSQIYFSYLSAATSSIPCPSPSSATGGGCAVQASQSGLQ